MKINLKKIQVIFSLYFLLFFSCYSQDKKLNLNELKKYVPKGMTFQKIDTFSIYNQLEYILTASDKKKNMTYEYWINNNEVVKTLKYPSVDINFKWFLNIDNDEDIEILRVQGFEDGINYVVNDILKDKEVPLIYFNPALIDKRYPNKIFWAYPLDIIEPIFNNKKEFLVSLHNNYQRDGEFIKPKGQVELPFVFFNGHTSQPNIVVDKLNKPQFMKINTVISNVGNTKNNVNPNNSSVKILQEYDYDLNSDGIKDKVILYQNNEEKGEFEKNHFGLPMVIKKGLANKSYQTWYENDLIIPKNNFNCAAEGFDTIVFKSNYFTIQNQICSSYIEITTYTTFKVVENKIVLHKYSETYFDKANHEKKIPAKTWGIKDFQSISFGDVTEDFLGKLRQTKPKK